MNNRILNSILDVYCDKYDTFNNSNGNPYEAFKWTAIKHFNEHWNPDVDDAKFAEMFREAFSKSYDLIDSSVRPLAGVREVLKHIEEVPFVRNCFKDLFAEDNGDLIARQNRIEKFITLMNNNVKKYTATSESWYWNFDTRTALACLNFARPGENYFYKFTELVKFIKAVNSEEIGTGRNFNLEEYYSYCKKIQEVVNNHEQINNIKEATINKDKSYISDNNHVLVYDVINDLKYFEHHVVENLLEKKTEIQKELAGLPNEKEIPSLVGAKISHKKFGDGLILDTNNDLLTVKFESKDNPIKLSYKFAINFITINDENYYAAEAFNKKLQEKRIALESEIAKAELEIAQFKLRTAPPNTYLTFHEKAKYECEIAGGYFWCPKNIIGSDILLKGYQKIVDLKPGDIVLNSCNQSIVSFFIVESTAVDGNKPKELNRPEASKEGRIIKCSYINLENPIRTYDYQKAINDNLGGKGNAFDSDGSGTSSYIGALKIKLAKVFINEILKNNPACVNYQYLKSFLDNY